MFVLALGQASEKADGCYIVSFKHDNRRIATGGTVNSQAVVSQARVKAAAKTIGRITAEYEFALNGFTVCGVKSESMLNSIKNNPFVDLVEQDQVVKVSAVKTQSNPAN